MRSGIIIQARTGSTRLPDKVVRPFDGERSMLELLVRRLGGNARGLPVYVATTVSPADDVIVALCERLGADSFRGPEADVLRRYVDASEAFGLDAVVRVCADNPFLDVGCLDRLVEAGEAGEPDYAGFVLADGTPAIRSHLGLFAEFVGTEALRRAERSTADAGHREHVTSFVYERPAEFELSFLDAPAAVADRADLRLTVDTPGDFDATRRIWRRLEREGVDPSVANVVAAVDADAALRRGMAERIERNRK